MYCHLCHIEASATHDSSSGHRAARQLVAVAIERLSNYLAVSEDAGTTKQDETDKTVKTPDTTIAVYFCDSCNIVVPVTEHASHLRRRDHALALLKEQEFVKLVHAYVGEGPNLEPTEPTDDGPTVDEAEAAITYTCEICNVAVSKVFKPVHERGTRHRASRSLTLVASRRARDMITTSQSDVHAHKFTGKMMKKLLKAYVGESGCYDDKTENVEAAVEPTKDSTRLTAKEYFTDILPFLPYVGSFYTLIIDNTEFVTIQIGSETVKIHVNNFNGLCNFEMNGGYNTKCRLCDGFTNMYYSSLGHQDKCHVMSLGHIKNVLSPIDSVHLIRNIDESHSICGLCNVHFASNLIDNHILKDTRHSMALSEALHKGKEYKEDKENLKIMIYMPPAQKQSIFMKPYQFNNNQNHCNFGVPQQPIYSGALFGGAQNTIWNTGFGSAQNTGLSSPQNSGFVSAQNTGFGSAQNTGFGSAHNTGFGIAQNTGFGNTRKPCFGSTQATGTPQDGAKGKMFGFAQTLGQTSAFSSATQQNTSVFGSVQNQGQTNAINNGSTQNTTTFGTAQNNIGLFGNSQASATGVQNKNALFGNVQNSTTTFVSAQAAQANSQQNPVNSGESQSNSTVFGSTQNTTRPSGNAQIKEFRFSTKTAGNAPDQTNMSSTVPIRSTVGDVKPLAGLKFPSGANSSNPQNFIFANAQSPINKESNESEQKGNNFSNAQAQSNVGDALINKPNTVRPAATSTSYNYSSSSSDEDCI